MLSIASIFIALLLQVPQLSHPPSPTPTKSSQEQQQRSRSNTTDSAAHDQPSKQSVVVTNPVTQEPQKTARDQSHNGSQDPPPDWITVLTGVIAFAGVAQVVAMLVQAHYMRRTMALTKQAADAATASADTARLALELTERAEMLIEQTQSSDKVSFAPIVVRIILKNFGRTTALDFGATVTVVPVTESAPDLFEEISPASTSTSSDLAARIGAQDIAILPIPPLRDWMSVENIKKLRNREIGVLFTIDAHYRDKFGQSHTIHATAKQNAFGPWNIIRAKYT